MSISYSGIVNYGKITLPSVESWGKNNNILRDPPKSITTRRIDKVFDTSLLTEEIDGSMDRVAESILVYPRGINPMVGISFDNNGSNAGVRTGQALLYSKQQTKLPYRVMREGAFRPPILREIDLLPLSRLPRNKTYIDPIANNPDFTKKLICPGEPKDYRSVKNETLKKNTVTNPTQNIQVPINIQLSKKYTQNLQLKGEKNSNINYTIGEKINPLINSTKYTDNIIRDIIKYNHVNLNINPNDTRKSVNTLENSKILNKIKINTPDKSIGMNSNMKGIVTKQPRHSLISFKTKDKPQSEGGIILNISKPNLSTIPITTQPKIKNNFKNTLKGEISLNNSQQGLNTRENIINKNTSFSTNKDILKGEISVNNSHIGLSNSFIDNNISRNKKLNPRLNIGFIDPIPTIPTTERVHDNSLIKNQDKGSSDLFSKARRLQQNIF
jgi:hypothetical protein